MLGSFSGIDVGLYRQGTNLIPIAVRLPDEERPSIDSIHDVQVWSNTFGRYVMIDEVVTEFPTRWEDALIQRKDRVVLLDQVNTELKEGTEPYKAVFMSGKGNSETKHSIAEFCVRSQRYFNVLCIAYGADTKLFGDIVSKGYLPKSRAEFCEEEYEQVQDAVDLLITPHIDLDLADEVMDRTWLREPTQSRATTATKTKPPPLLGCVLFDTTLTCSPSELACISDFGKCRRRTAKYLSTTGTMARSGIGQCAIYPVLDDATKAFTIDHLYCLVTITYHGYVKRSAKLRPLEPACWRTGPICFKCRNSNYAHTWIIVPYWDTCTDKADKKIPKFKQISTRTLPILCF